MELEYYMKEHIGVSRMYVADKTKRMWLQKLTKHSTITESDLQALKGLGIKLIKVENKERK